MRDSRAHGLRSMVVAALVSLAFVLLGHLFVLQRTSEGSTEHGTIRGDTLQYLSMIEASSGAASPPFRYRPLVPLIAKWIPLPAIEALRAISYGSLFISYFAIQWVCLRLRISAAASIAGLLVLFGSTHHLYIYHNPFLVDAFGVAALSIMLCGLVGGSFLAFATAAMLGVAARETSVFLVPAWLLHSSRWGSLLIAATAAVLITLRIDPSVGFAGGAANAFSSHASARVSEPILFATEIILSWGSAWLTTLAGLCLFGGRHFVTMLAVFFALLSGAFLTSLLASDLARMFLILSPVVAVASGQFFMKMMERRLYLWVSILVAILLAQSVVVIPNVILGEVLNGARLLKLSMLIATTLVVVTSIVMLREDVLTAFRQNWQLLSSPVRRSR